MVAPYSAIACMLRKLKNYVIASGDSLMKARAKLVWFPETALSAIKLL